MFPGAALAGWPGDLLSGISILVAEIISMEGMKDTVKIRTDPPHSPPGGVGAHAWPR